MNLGILRSGPLFKPRFRSRLRPLTFRLDVAPWLNVAAVFFFFGLAGSRFVLHPGMDVDLPETPFRGGIPYNAHAITIQGNGTRIADGTGARESYFFDGQKMPREELMARLNRLARENPDAPLILKAGSEIPHGLVLDLCFQAQSAGLRRVVLATRTGSPSQAP